MAPSLKPPSLLPKTQKEERRVFLELALWEDLTDTAEFHTETFKEMGADEKVSRNDLIESFLRWALKAFWDDKGGRPKTAAERKKKVAAFAEWLKAERAAQAQSNQEQDR